MADDGQVRIGIYVDSKSVESSMDEAVKSVQDGAKKMGDAAEEAGKRITDSFDVSKLQQSFKSAEATVSKFAKTISASIAGFGVWVKASASSIDRIDKMSQKLGVSRKAFQELDYAASQTGLSIEQFSSSMRVLVSATNDGGDAFEQLGVSIRDASGDIKSQEELFFDVIDKLADMPAGIERTQVGFQLLGKNFQQLAPLINQGSEGIRQLRQNFHDLGLEVDDTTIDNFVKFNDTVSDMSKTLKQAFNNAIKGIIPQLQKFVEQITKSLAPGGELAKMLSNIAEIILNITTNVLPAFLSGLNWVIKNAELVAGGITAVSVSLKLLTGNWIGAIASGLIGIFSTTLIAQAKTTKATIEETTAALKELGVEASKSGGISPIVEVTGNLDEMSKKLEQSKKDLEDYERALSLLEFDTTITNSKQLADKQDELRSKILTARTEIEKYSEAINRVNERQKKKGGIIDTTNDERNTFEMFTIAVELAEAALRDFIAAHSSLETGFNLASLTDSDMEEFSALRKNVADARAALETLEAAFEDTREEAKNTDAFEKWTNALKDAEDELKAFIALHTDLDGKFDVSLLTDEELDKFNTLKDNLTVARSNLESLTDALKETTEEEVKNVDATNKSADAFEQWTSALHDAEAALKAFVAEHSTLEGGFDVSSLSEADLAQYDELKAKVSQTKDAIDSMNDAISISNDELEEARIELENTDSFYKWIKAVHDAEKALKDFIAAHSEDTGTFDITRLTDAEREKFDQLKKSVQEAKDQLKSLQDATNDTTKNMSDNLVNVAETIASAWGQVGLALGNGIEAVIATLTNGEFDLKEAGLNLADALTSTISAIGDALIQAGIAKQVAENLGNVTGPYAISMGLAIKAAAGALKGLFDNLRGGGKFAEGGIVGGNSYYGDKMIAHVNSGEMILNRKQQRTLFDLANGGAGGGSFSSNIQIINNAGADVNAETSPDGRSIKIMVEKITENMLKGVKGSKIMGRTYGVRQLGRR